MLRRPVRCGVLIRTPWIRYSSSNSIRRTFIEYFKDKHNHRIVKSSPVVPLCDPTVPFVNAGMNQFKGIFLGQVEPPYPRVVNSQKCIRVGGKHNDLDIVGTDGTHHTFFEMLGNWSFGDYYKSEACKMAWELLTGPYGLNAENLLVTYFEGDPVINLLEDREVRDIWKSIGVPDSRLKAFPGKDNFWEMGPVGPCGPCTEIHHINSDGSITEIWNLVFIQCKREANGEVRHLSKQYVDTGMGLERMAALLQGVPSNYETDLFQPIIKAIEKNSKVNPYGGSYDKHAQLDTAYRRLADHARMISVCLADGVYPSVSVNLKQIMRKCYKLSADVFGNPKLLHTLYQEVASSLGATYPELVHKEREAKLIIDHEEAAYERLREQMVKSWRDLVLLHPEVEPLWDVELASLSQGYRDFKKEMKKHNTKEIDNVGHSKGLIPGHLVFKMYDTHGFPEEIIERVAKLNKLQIDREGFENLLTQHKARHKTALKEQSSNKGHLFNQAIEKLIKHNIPSTNDQYKYAYKCENNNIVFEPLSTELVAILNGDLEWIDFTQPSTTSPYYLVSMETNFFCEEGGQPSDTGTISVNENTKFTVDSVFKIRDFVFHKGYFSVSKDCNVSNTSSVVLEIDSERRSKHMRNHTAMHLLNAAVRKTLPDSVVCQIGSSVSEKGVVLNLSVYGGKLSQDVMLKVQDCVRQAIAADTPVQTRVLDSVAVSLESGVTTVPGETYPETGLRLVETNHPLHSKELCCGTHAPSTGLLNDFVVTLVKGAGGNSPVVHALTGPYAREARELFCRARKLSEVIHLADPKRRKDEISALRRQLTDICGSKGSPAGEYAETVALLEGLPKASAASAELASEALQLVAIAEVQEAVTKSLVAGRRFVVHFLRCSYLMQGEAAARALAAAPAAPVLLLGCAGGLVVAGARVPGNMVTEDFNAKLWLGSILPVFEADVLPGGSSEYAEMTATKVSLINCEELVQDAMRLGVAYAKKHIDSNQVADVELV